MRLMDISREPALPAIHAVGGASVVGSWSGGRRHLFHKGRLWPAHVWFHFAPGGKVTLSVRHDDAREAQLVSGRWSIEGSMLVVSVGHSMVRAPFAFDEEVMYWAGEALVRIVDLPPRYPLRA